MEKSVVITFETIYEILRREKSKDDIQKLDDSFFNDVIAYLNDKNDFKADFSKKNDMFSSFTQDDIVVQIHNVKKILRELYDRREKKIIEMALNKSRTNSNIITTINLLEHEKRLFESLVSILLDGRNVVLFPLLNGKSPEYVSFNSDKSVTQAVVQSEKSEKKSESQSEKQSEKHIRFLESIDTFVGSELEEYGPFNANDSAYIPNEIAAILIENGKAVELSK